MSQDLELVELISSHYDQPIPSAEYHAALLQRMQVATSVSRRRGRRIGMMAAAACLFVVGTSAWWIRSALDRRPPAAPPATAVVSQLPENVDSPAAPSPEASRQLAFEAPNLGG